MRMQSSTIVIDMPASEMALINAANEQIREVLYVENC